MFGDDFGRVECLTRWTVKHQGVSLKRSLLRHYLVLFQSGPALEILIDQGCAVSYAQKQEKFRLSKQRDDGFAELLSREGPYGVLLAVTGTGPYRILGQTC